jgi:hypothetical protein
MLYAVHKGVSRNRERQLWIRASPVVSCRYPVLHVRPPTFTPADEKEEM